MEPYGSATVTTECTCENYDDATDTYEPSDYCYGDCGEMAWEDAIELIAQWAKHWDTDAVRIEATNATWQRLRGYTELTFHNEFSEALRAFTIGGDFRLELSVDELGQLSVRRFSHDEPMGCSMVALPISEWSE
jgi:hypothetical protein